MMEVSSLFSHQLFYGCSCTEHLPGVGVSVCYLNFAACEVSHHLHSPWRCARLHRLPFLYIITFDPFLWANHTEGQALCFFSFSVLLLCKSMNKSRPVLWYPVVVSKRDFAERQCDSLDGLAGAHQICDILGFKLDVLSSPALSCHSEAHSVK